MSYIIRRPQFKTTVDFLLELPWMVVESILRMSLDKTNYKALKYVIASTSALTVERKGILYMIDRITSENDFLREQLTLNIKINNMVTEHKGTRIWDKCKFLDNDETDVLKELLHGYKCIQYINPRKRPYQLPDINDRRSIVILDFWKMYSRQGNRDLMQQIIHALRLAVKGTPIRRHMIRHISFKVKIIGKEIENIINLNKTQSEKELDIFLQLELIALNGSLFKHIDTKLTHQSPFTMNFKVFGCACPGGIWKHENSGSITGWSFIEAIGGKHGERLDF